MTMTACTSVSSLEAIRKRYTECGQGHAVQNLTDDSLESFTSIPVESIEKWHEQATTNDDATAAISPFTGTIANASEVQDIARPIGLAAIAKGQVAALVLAGGQGTRLGFEGPKGLFPLYDTTDNSQTLFSLLASRLRKLSQLAGSTSSSIPLYIMTSPLNDQTTREYWKENDNFGLETVVFFTQGMLPCLTKTGAKIIMETPTQMAMAPDGNGGVYRALPLDDMKARGVAYVHAFSIDNALTLPADPILTGFCIQHGADVGNKVVWRTNATEAVGVMAEKGGAPCIVEYSEMSPSLAALTHPENPDKLVYGAANICNHWYTVDFLESVPGSIPYHAAYKKIPYWDGSKTVTPEDKNGMKLETFIFDVFARAKNLVVLEVDRAEEFSPVKNATGSDSPDTAREHLDCRNRSWLTAAGATLVGTGPCMIAPSTSYAGEGLEDIVAKYPEGKLQFPISL